MQTGRLSKYNSSCCFSTTHILRLLNCTEEKKVVCENVGKTITCGIVTQKRNQSI